MPIPQTEETTGPRRLLRDVVFDKMLAAIVDGTLEPGERLNDDQLVKWLGVSRTPVREAIAQLHSYGLVEIEANRYTRVAEQDESVYAEAAQLLEGLHDLGARLAADKLDASSRKAIGKSLAAASKQIKAHDPAGAAALLDVRGELTAASGNALLIEAEGPLRTRVQFLSPRESNAYDWAALKSSAEAVEKFVKL
ncbi:GntR family transcriptional regulator [Frigoribacterium sp. ME-P-080]|uniref:GntR family transcriptional regulator n=1 Tax=Frigoribacterium sp. ME-P-080 TaxID=3040289 RepID=UPI00254AF806|nr:GntR family transcriptional regulator [Frigoribacterium sp. ME-P-080]